MKDQHKKVAEKVIDNLIGDGWMIDGARLEHTAIKCVESILTDEYGDEQKAPLLSAEDVLNPELFLIAWLKDNDLDVDDLRIHAPKVMRAYAKYIIESLSDEQILEMLEPECTSGSCFTESQNHCDCGGIYEECIIKKATLINSPPPKQGMSAEDFSNIITKMLEKHGASSGAFRIELGKIMHQYAHRIDVDKLAGEIEDRIRTYEFIAKGHETRTHAISQTIKEHLNQRP